MFISGFAGSWKHEAEGVVWFLSIDLGLSARLRLISSLSLISSGLGKFMKSFFLRQSAAACEGFMGNASRCRSSVWRYWLIILSVNKASGSNLYLLVGKYFGII